MRYTLGIICGLLIGLLYNGSALIQKAVIKKADHSKPLMGQLLRHPLWLLSVATSGGLVLVLTLIGQMLIGPTLIPGLSAIGMIILPIGARKFIGERNGLKEYLGIFAIILGVFLLSFSKLTINTEEVSWLESSFLHRTLWYVGGMSVIALVFLLAGRSQKKRHRFLTAILYCLSGGMLFGISNIIAAPLSAQVGILAGQAAGQVHWGYLITSAAYLALINIAAVPLIQKAYAFGHVSVLVPIQQVPIQIVPIISHFWFFSGVFPNAFSMVGVPAAVILILLGAVALGSRQS